MKIKRILQIVLCLLLFMGNTMKVRAEEGKLIYFVYDNSKSMVKVGRDEEGAEAPADTPRNWGAQAQYAVKAFCTMSNPEDEIWFYPIDESKVNGTWPRTITNPKGMSNYQKEYTEIIDEIKFNGQETKYGQIETAINDMKNGNFSGEKWVVMFTDGDIEELDKTVYGDDTFNELLKRDLRDTGINFYFVDLCPKEESKNPVETQGNIYSDRLVEQENGTILQSILKVTEKIYGKRRLQEEIIKESIKADSKTLSVEFGIPVHDVMIILQAEEAGEEESRISFDNYFQNSPKYEISSLSQSNDGNINGPYGIIANCDNYLKKNGNNYTLSVEIPKEITEYAVYYTPATEVQIVVNQEIEGVKEGNYVEGEAVLGVQLINAETKKVIKSQSPLLENESVDILVDGNRYTIGIYEELVLNLEVGEVEIEAETSMGKAETLSIDVKEEPRKYELKADTETDIFYYNRLEEKENAVIVQLVNEETNSIAEIKDKDLKVSFWQGDRKVNNLDCELGENSGEHQKLIYPLLEDNKNREISGDLTCKIEVIKEVDYYEKDLKYETEILLPMDVEEVFQIEIPEDSKENIKNWKLLLPIGRTKVEPIYTWNGEELEWKETDEIETTLYIQYSDEVKEIHMENELPFVKGSFYHFKNFPSEIELVTKATYTAFGKPMELEIPEDIYLEEVDWKDKAIALTILLGMLMGIMIILCIIFNLGRIIVWSIKDKRLIFFAPKVYSRYVDSRFQREQKAKIKYEWMVKILLLSNYCYRITVNIYTKEKEKKLLLEVFTRKDTYKIRVIEKDSDWKVQINGMLITEEFEEFSKSLSEIYFDARDRKPQIITIQFGGRE